MQEYLIFDASSGISGDMAAAALIDLCGDPAWIEPVFQPFAEMGYRYSVESIEKNGQRCLQTSVIGDRSHEAHHHSLAEIHAMIDQADLSERVRQLALDIYARIARAESSVHGLPAEEVAFHEVGSVPSVLNVIAFAAAFDRLGIREVIIPNLYEGHGAVRCAHGEVDVPVPAVKELIKEAGVPLTVLEAVPTEILTPTGCACVLTVRTGGSLPESSDVIKTGYGAGRRDTGLSGILKAEIRSDI